MAIVALTAVTVLTGLDVPIYNTSVTDYAAWASRRLDAGLVCLHVLDRKPIRPKYY